MILGIYRTLTLAAFSFSPVSKWHPCTASSTDDSLGKQFAVNIRSRITSSREKFDGQLLFTQQSDYAGSGGIKLVSDLPLTVSRVGVRY